MTQNSNTLRLEGAMTIKTAVEAHENMLAALRSANARKLPLEIDIPEDCNCDLTLPQLLLSAQATAARDGIELRIRAAHRGPFFTTLERAGLSAAFDGDYVTIMNGDQR